jgi:hypothetical protein
LAQYSLKELIILTIGGTAFSCKILFCTPWHTFHNVDDAQADVDDVTVVYWVACSAGLGSPNEEAQCEGFKTFGGMPGGGHSLLISLAIFGCGTPVLCDEPFEHVEKDSVQLFDADWLVCFSKCFLVDLLGKHWRGPHSS